MTDGREPTPRRIAIEILVYALLVIGVGALFVGARVMMHGPLRQTRIPVSQPPR